MTFAFIGIFGPLLILKSGCDAKFKKDAGVHANTKQKMRNSAHKTNATSNINFTPGDESLEKHKYGELETKSHPTYAKCNIYRITKTDWRRKIAQFTIGMNRDAETTG